NLRPPRLCRFLPLLASRILLAGTGFLLTFEDNQDVELARVILILHGHRPQQTRARLLVCLYLLEVLLVGRRSGWPRGCPQASQLVTMADPVSIRGRRSPSRHLRDEHSFGAFGRFGARPSGGLYSAGPGPRMQHHSPLTRWRTSRQDGPMREGASRDLGTGPGAGRSCGPGAHLSPLPWAAATLGLRPDPFAALLWWWTRVATTAT